MRQKPGPVPTIYKGQRFRSREEAQWAAFLDTLAVGWQYQLISLGSAYLPDFWLPTYRVWGEVQTNWPGEQAVKGMELLVHQTDNPLILFKGPPPLPTPSDEKGNLAYCLAKPLGWGFTQVAFCKKCESVVFMFIWRESKEKKSVLLPPQCPCCGYLFDAPPPERLVKNPLHLKEALIAAHSADFEPAR
jgi:hypothetical protein